MVSSGAVSIAHLILSLKKRGTQFASEYAWLPAETADQRVAILNLDLNKSKNVSISCANFTDRNDCTDWSELTEERTARILMAFFWISHDATLLIGSAETSQAICTVLHYRNLALDRERFRSRETDVARKRRESPRPRACFRMGN